MKPRILGFLGCAALSLLALSQVSIRAAGKVDPGSILGGDLLGECELTGKTCAEGFGSDPCLGPWDPTCLKCRHEFVTEENCVGWSGLCLDGLTQACGVREKGDCIYTPTGENRCIWNGAYDGFCKNIREC